MVRQTLLMFTITLCLAQTVFSQESKIITIEQKGKFYKAIEFEVKRNTLYTSINPSFKATSLTIETAVEKTLERAYILLGGQEKFLVKPSSHVGNEDGTEASRSPALSSEQYISSEPFDFFSLYTGDMEGKIRVNLIYADPIKLEKNTQTSKKKSLSDCVTQPESIDQSVWRIGLPEPTVNPTPTLVKHVILHHSAGSNTNTDYVNVVRNIYVYHTQTNGWSDIAYNYLVAQDGTIFDGRDGKEYGDDNVVGAHMCGRNSNTMGICLLGNYHDNAVYPTDTSIRSVEKLLVWKLYKEQLSAFDSSLHPVTNPVGYLGNIAGHREGCNVGYTECPGDNYYQIIYSRMKHEVDSVLQECNAVGINYTLQDHKKVITLFYPNPTSSRIFLNTSYKLNPKNVQLMNMQGQILYSCNSKEEMINGIDISFLPQGIYIIKVSEKELVMTQKINLIK